MPSPTYITHWTRYRRSTAPAYFQIYNNTSLTAPFTTPTYFPCLQVRHPTTLTSNVAYGGNLFPTFGLGSTKTKGRLYTYIRTQGMTTGTLFFGFMVHLSQEDVSNMLGNGYALYGTTLGSNDFFGINRCNAGFVNSGGTAVSGTQLAVSSNGLVNRSAWMSFQVRWEFVEISPGNVSVSLSIQAGTDPVFENLPTVVSATDTTTSMSTLGFTLCFMNNNAPGSFLIGPLGLA